MRENRLARATSPYLLQHAHNPVDWYPWDREALERAAREDLPIFLSVGYAACHWCHVMERESFEDEAIAELLNRHFVPVKVDREERPDVDGVYMNAVQLMTGQGGWPMSVFLTPDLRPFLCGTYFPPRAAHGRIGFHELLERIHEAWTTRRDEIERTAGKVTEDLRSLSSRLFAPGNAPAGDDETIDADDSARGAAELAGRFDSRWGGFGAAPKFPPDGGIALLMREHRRSGEDVPLQMALHTLDAMARGGIHDHLGGGFARYSVDERWLVPHFEKMLYNQALLVPLYVDAWRLTGQPRHRRVAERTLDFVYRELRDEAGGFWSSLDADSEGREGAFYVWSRAEIEDVLGAAASSGFCEAYGVTAAGNFEGASILNRLDGQVAADDRVFDAWSEAREKLLARRAGRPRPATDDKVLTAWNGLMISACARAWQAFSRKADLQAARRAADFLLGTMVRDGRLLASYRRGEASHNAYLDDHAFLARGLLDLYESDFDRRWLDAAASLARTLVRRFEDPGVGGFFFTSDDHETLLTRERSLHDGALPSGAGVAAETLLRLGLHLDDDELRGTARRALRALRPLVRRAPSACSSLLLAAEWQALGAVELALVGDGPRADELLAAARKPYLPRLAIAATREREGPAELPLLAGKRAPAGEARAWLCRNYACREPTGDPSELARALREDGAPQG